MFAYIKGKIEVKSNDFIVIETAGIGYKIFMSNSAIDKLPEIGQEVKIHTHYHVREDNISLYGFITNDELRMFELLIGVSGIGAKSAITMLSNITPSGFALAVISDDTSKLVKIPGIGAKSAARIILELKDKLKTEQAITNKEQTNEIKQAVQQDNKQEEITSALQVLGYTRKEIEKVIDQIGLTTISIEDGIRKALAILGK